MVLAIRFPVVNFDGGEKFQAHVDPQNCIKSVAEEHGPSSDSLIGCRILNIFRVEAHMVE